MAEETIILDIELNSGKSLSQLTELLNTMKDLKEEKKKLDGVVAEGKATDEQVARLKQVETQMKVNKKEINSLTAQLDQARKGGDDYGDSLNEMRRKLSDMQKTYDGLSKAERENADVGGKLQEAIKEQHDAVLELEGATGRMQRNVGNYQKAFVSAIPGFDKFNSILEKMGLSLEDISDIIKGFSDKVGQSFSNLGSVFSGKANEISKGLGKIDSSVKTVGSDTLKTANTLGEVKDKMGEAASGGSKAFGELGKSVKAFGKLFLTPPIIIIAAIVGAIVLAVNKLKEAFNRSDDAGTALASGLAVLKPIGTAIRKVFEELANVIGKLVEGMGSAVIAVAKLANAVGIGDGEFVKAAEDAKKLVKATDDLEEAERQYTVSAAKNEKEISRLRLEAENERDPKKRKKLLDEATKLEGDNLEAQKAILKKRVENLKAKSKEEVDTSDETKNAIAQAEAELELAEKASYDRRKEISAQLRAAKQEEAAAAKEAADKQIEIATTLQQKIIDATKDEGMRELLQVQLKYDQEIAGYKKQLKDKKGLTKQAQEDLQELITLAEEARGKEVNEITKRQIEERLKIIEDSEKKTLELRLSAAKEGSEEEHQLRVAMLQLEFDEARQAADKELSESLERFNGEEQAKAELKAQWNEQKLLAEEIFRQQLAEIDEQYNQKEVESAQLSKAQIIKNNAEIAQMYSTQMNNMLANASSAFSALASLYDEDAENSAEAQKKRKGLAAASIAMSEASILANTATSIAAAVAAASEASVFTGAAAPIAIVTFIASMTAAVLSAVAGTASTIAQAKQLVETADTGSYATGGIIGGSSYTGDRLTANVNSGEMILNRDQQTRLFDIANGQGGNIFDYSIMTEAMVAAVAAQPAPVMAYEEFKSFQSRTATYDEFARI